MKKLLLTIGIAAFLFNANGQQVIVVDNTGSGTYQTITEAFNYLNSLSPIPAGGVIVNITAGQTFNETPPALTVVGTSSAPIVIQRFGNGPNPVIQAQNPDNNIYVLYLNGAKYVTIDGIDIEDPVVSDNQFYQVGIYLNNAENNVIRNCNVANFSRYGIFMTGTSKNNNIVANKIYYDTAFRTPQLTIYGIYVNYNAAADSVVIDRNHIYNLHRASIVGIRVERVRGFVTNNMVMIADTAKDVQGVRLGGGTENRTIRAYHNTVLLSGGATGESYPLYFTGADGTFIVKNNIFINQRNDQTYTHSNVFIGFRTATAPTFDLTNNIYYNAKNNGFMGKIQTVTYESLDAWQTTAGLDQRSKVLNVSFSNLANYTLHLSSTHAGSPSFVGDILGIPHDFDGETRSEIPYIGADELAYAPFIFYNVAISPDTLNFGEVALGFSSTLEATLINNQTTIVGFDSIVAPRGWLLSVDGEPFAQKIYSIFIAGNITKTMEVKFQPTNLGTHQGKIIAYIGFQQLEIVLTAMAISADLAISHTEINVGSTPIYVPIEYSSFKVYNISDIVQNVNISVTGNYSLRFANGTDWFTSYNNLLIQPGDSLVFVIKFDPQSYNFHNEVITVTNLDYTFQCTLVGRALGVKFHNISQNNFIKTYNGSNAWGDFDGDGLQDLVITGYTTAAYKGYMRVYKNLGGGNFQQLNQQFTGVGNSAVVWVDIDNDGDLDIVAMGQDSLNLFKTFIIENQNGVFIERLSQFIPGLSGGSIDVADFNGDGYFDLLITGEQYIPNSENVSRTGIYLNNKNKDFVLYPTNLPLVTSGHAAAADFNNDGLIDVAITGRVSSFNFETKVYMNQGTNQFAEIALPGAQGLRYSKVRWGDYDNDGYLDLLITGSFDNQQNSLTYVFRNTGEDSFELVHQMPGVRLGDIQWGDFNNDGYLDIVMNGIYNDAIWLGRIYIYKPDTKNYLLVDTIVDMRATNISLCDFNADGKLDFFVTGRYAYQDYRALLYENQWHVTNNPPQAPASLSVIPAGSFLVLDWDEASDDKSSVTYNLRIGTQPGLGDIYNAYNSSNSVMSSPALGNMGTKTLIMLPWNHTGTFYASVQAIDASFRASEWSTSEQFTYINENVFRTISIHPNPARERILITGTFVTEGIIHLEIYTLAGRKIYAETIEQGLDNLHHYLNIQQLQQGVYMVRLTGSEKNYTTLLTVY